MAGSRSPSPAGLLPHHTPHLPLFQFPGFDELPLKTGYFVSPPALAAGCLGLLSRPTATLPSRHTPFGVQLRPSRPQQVGKPPPRPPHSYRQVEDLSHSRGPLWEHEAHFGAEIKFAPASLFMIRHPHTWHTWILGKPGHPIKSDCKQLHQECLKDT